MSTENTGSSVSQESTSGHAQTQERGNSEFTDLLSTMDHRGPNTAAKEPSVGGNAAVASGAQPATAGGAGTGDARVPSKPAGEQATQAVATQSGAGAAAAQGEQRTQAAQATTAGGGGQTQTGIDPAVLQQIVEASVSGANAAQRQQQAQTQQQQAEKPLTDAEFSAKYRLPAVDVNFIAALREADPAQAAQALQQKLLQAVQSGLLMGQDSVKREFQSLREEYSPHINSWKQMQERQRDEAAFNDFMKANSDLKDEVPLVLEMKDAVLARIQNGTFKPKSQQEAFQAIATAARQIVQRMQKQTSTASSGTTQAATQSATATRQMAAASTAGQSGSGQPAKKSDEEQIFGNEFV